MNKKQQFLAAGLLIFISRIPFLFDGYGAEEDAWALRLVAENIARSGNYEVSRLPGHPLQELVYAGIWKGGPFLFNLLTALLSTIGILYFIKTLEKLEVKNAVLAGLALAAIPVVYINSTNAMDYTWSMAFVLIAFHQLTTKRYAWSGFFLALATGCRITSAVFGLPFLLFLFWFDKPAFRKSSLYFISAAAITTLVLFTPVINTYGLSFFTFYEHFPIPGFSKNFYKGVIAVWGLPLLFATIPLVIAQLRERAALTLLQRKLMLLCGFIALLVILMFLRVPLKSAFMIPLVPFVILAAAIFFSVKRLQLFTGAAIVSCFMFGLNLDDSLRGSAKSQVAVSFKVNDQQVAFDPLQGLLIADRTKRIQRTSFSVAVLNKSKELNGNPVVIAGWWLADILVLEKEKSNHPISWRYYIEEDSLKYFRQECRAIYFLPEQDALNDLRYKGAFTSQYAIPYPLLP